MTLTEKLQKRAALVKEAREILDAAKAEKRELTAEENQKYERIDAEIDKLTAEIRAAEQMEQREKRLRELEGEMAERRDNPFKPVPAQQNKLDFRASKEYRDAFFAALKSGRNALYPDELRALQVGTASEGGYLVPTEFERRLIDALQDENVMRTIATVITTANDTVIPVVASHGTAVWTAEEGDFSESDDTFAQISLGAHKLTTLIKVSEELLRDAAFDIEAYIAAEFARRIGRAEEAAFVAGDGNGKPAGVIGGAQVGVTTAATNAITSDELIDLFHSLRRPYRQNARWLMADATAKVIRKLKDNDGQYIWQPGLTASQPDTLLGRPVTISDDVPAIAAGAKAIAFGDFSYYWIADRQGRVFQRLNELYAVKGQVGFRAFQRVDGKLTLAEAVKVLQMKTS